MHLYAAAQYNHIIKVFLFLFLSPHSCSTRSLFTLPCGWLVHDGDLARQSWQPDDEQHNLDEAGYNRSAWQRCSPWMKISRNWQRDGCRKPLSDSQSLNPQQSRQTWAGQVEWNRKMGTGGRYFSVSLVIKAYQHNKPCPAMLLSLKLRRLWVIHGSINVLTTPSWKRTLCLKGLSCLLVSYLFKYIRIIRFFWVDFLFCPPTL